MSATTAEPNYIVPTQQRPRSFTFDPADGLPRTTAFLLPDPPPDALTRESIELRTLMFHKD